MTRIWQLTIEHKYVSIIHIYPYKVRNRHKLTSLTKKWPCLSGYTNAKESFAFRLLAAGATSLTFTRNTVNHRLADLKENKIISPSCFTHSEFSVKQNGNKNEQKNRSYSV